MRRFVKPGTTLNGALPTLEFFAVQGGLLVDLFSLEFEVWNTDLNQSAVARTVVNVGITHPTAGAGKLSKGRYFATWAVPTSQVHGAYEVRWFWKVLSTDAEKTAAMPFEIWPVIYSGYGYATVGEMRAEGASAEMSASRILRAVLLAGQYIERVTGHWFEPRAAVYTLDGDGARILRLPAPIVGIVQVKTAWDQDFANADVVDPAEYRIYARHLSHGLVSSPDDRFRPRLERVGSLDTSGAYWPEGHANVQVQGAFGFTDPDALLPAGRTPESISLACRLLAMRYLPQIADPTRRDGPGGIRTVVGESTRDQSITYAEPAWVAAPGSGMTGDQEVDALLLAFKRIPTVGVV